MSDPVVLLSTGDVVGPAGGVTDNSMVLFSGTSGKLIKGNNAVVTAAGLALLDDVDAAAQRVTLGLGTAATATLTTSATDTTAGRVTKVGDFGLGASSIDVPNMDSLSIPTGFYYYGESTAGAKPSTYGTVAITAGAGGAWAMQQAHTTSNVILARNNINNTGWTPWREVALTDSPAFIGTPTAPTAAAGTNTTQLATTAFVTTADNLKANINSPTFTGVPSAPTAFPGTNTEQLANTAFVKAAVDAAPRVGVGQTWQNVTGSRAKSVTYTNSTGKPILVHVQKNSGQNTLTLAVDGLAVSQFGGYGIEAQAAVTAIVPNGSTYIVGGSGSISSWAELR